MVDYKFQSIFHPLFDNTITPLVHLYLFTAKFNGFNGSATNPYLNFSACPTFVVEEVLSYIRVLAQFLVKLISCLSVFLIANTDIDCG